MSSLTPLDKHKLEKAFNMANGFVLDFSDKSFQAFALDSVKLDIQDEKYNLNSGSKANRLRSFWAKESDQVVGKLTHDMLGYWKYRKDDAGAEISEVEQKAYEEACQISERLKGRTDVEHIETAQVIAKDENFQLLASQIKDNIENGQPEAGLDRLHTYLMKYFRHLCEKRGIAADRDEPLNSVFGKYVKALQAASLIKSDMSELILKSSISLLSKFNYVRNNQSLAHDNKTLNREESFLIFRNISALMKFVESIEGI
ncbi:abortive infection family protein [Hymenobacter monticola]|uniref:Abortive infection family protein n=1 Tax=Hymenobacter monticola TaxID=1705399 RepID=A0ABY4B2E8_9BACT|nr:abortive infection family protein [Hymenobacter monticola]UOE33297.1 abortive infection family protein [Hymenobacter monticola]